jgi:glycosyltransferase involved in cell wall biosynthesis
LWADPATLDRVRAAPWLDKQPLGWGARGLLARLLWLIFALPRAARSRGIALIFAPGGLVAGGRIARVTMSRNMLPFEPAEASRYGWSRTGTRLRLLRRLQTASFRRADGVIFLTDHARRRVQAVTGPLARVATIPHGVGEQFRIPPRPARSGGPLTVIYVSIVDLYKHQWRLVEAAAELVRSGIAIRLILIGPAYPPALAKLEAAIAAAGPDRGWIEYRGPQTARQIAEAYRQADAGVFLSSCENMPNILLEMMAAGLPILCSDRGPMPEMLGDAGLYCDPENPGSIAQGLRRLVDAPELRVSLASRAHQAAAGYTWQRCSRETMAFLDEVARMASPCAA